MFAVADEQYLYSLDFGERLGGRLPPAIIQEKTSPIKSIEKELKAYFEGKLKQFKTPIQWVGTDFQRQVWQALCNIPYGETSSYVDQAKSIHKPTAYRAVANANGKNQLAIIVPCHRVIRSQGGLGGYAGGVAKKAWLLAHEKKYKLRRCDTTP